jgi:hypothetical protein
MVAWMHGILNSWTLEPLALDFLRARAALSIGSSVANVC